jgi:biotin carboxyl carrier protein
MKVNAIVNKKRNAEIELISHTKNQYRIQIDDRILDFNILTEGNGSYSIIYNNRSWEMEVVKSGEFNNFTVFKFGETFNIEIEDALSKYKKNKNEGQHGNDSNIVAPMPGKIVKILVEQGQEVKSGDTVLIISAMKMESEFKSAVDGMIKRIHVAENDIVNGNQLLVEIEKHQNS